MNPMSLGIWVVGTLEDCLIPHVVFSGENYGRKSIVYRPQLVSRGGPHLPADREIH